MNIVLFSFLFFIERLFDNFLLGDFCDFFSPIFINLYRYYFIFFLDHDSKGDCLDHRETVSRFKFLFEIVHNNIVFVVEY